MIQSTIHKSTLSWVVKAVVSWVLLSTSVASFASSEVPKNEAAKIAKEVQQFVDMMVEEHGYDKSVLANYFNDVQPNQKILKTMARPAEAAMPWHRYRNIFIQQERVDLGIKFWNEHKATLERAEQTFGVPAELIVGLIGVETKYGRIKGNYDVFNALYTLAFHYPRRAKFFRKELKEYLILAKEQEWAQGEIKGSYAGAMGYGQFMPSSYRMYAVDFDNDGKINLLTNPVDAIGSVANYIKVHGWKQGGAMVYPTEVSGDGYKSLLQKRLKPKVPLSRFIEAGVKVTDDLDIDQKAILIELEQKEAKEYWIGLHNFYVISRYNPRTLYTMAVIQLTEMIRDQYNQAS